MGTKEFKEQIKPIIASLVTEWENSQDASFPERQKLTDLVIEILSNFKIKKVLDLGTGSGSISKRILETFPDSNVIGLDFDPIMLELASHNLSNFKRRFLSKPRNLLQNNWAAGLPNDFDTVISSLALHHLPDNRRKAIYKDLFALMKSPGIFFCIDEVKSGILPFDNFVSANLETARVGLMHQRNAKDWISFWNWVGDQLGIEQHALKLLEKTYPDGTDTKGTLIDQLDHLKNAGFTVTECFYRNHAMAVYGAFK
jgi:SAM-dependent methyltransferase